MKKNFISGFISGALIFGVVGALAATYTATDNPFSVKVNGVETAIEGYNINDSTYFKLRDIADAIGGFNVDFKDNTIVLETETAPTPATAPDIAAAKADLSPLPEVEVETFDGIEYVRKSNIEKMLDSIGLGNYEFGGPYFYDKNNRMVEPLLNNIQLHPTNNELIPLECYINTVIPAINSLR